MVATVLVEQLGFSAEDLDLIVDADATRENIMSKFLKLTSELIGDDDRIVIFFAGHGDTRTGRRGEVGYLIPVDGDPDSLESLIRWDDLTRNSDMIAAKHILFIMDACYGGLAVTRSLAPRSMRFVKNMLERSSRQVLTAGKANEVVADSGGPRPGHSIFTGHLLEGIEGAAIGADGLLTANGLMAYVYERVSRDVNSNQTPHYGYIDGDGDMILIHPAAETTTEGELDGTSSLVKIPESLEAPLQADLGSTLAGTVKEFLSERRLRIHLSDLADEEWRVISDAVRSDTNIESGSRAVSNDFTNRIATWDSRMTRLLSLVALTAYWGEADHRPVIVHTIVRLADGVEAEGGRKIGPEFQWYPLQLAMYAGGIAALASGNYDNLFALLMTRVSDQQAGTGRMPAIVPVVKGVLGAERADLFRKFPGHDKHYTPRSEYLFQMLQPQLEDLLPLGSEYENLFDQFEILFALAHADVSEETRGRVWGPPGRFGWKHYDMLGSSPYDDLTKELLAVGDDLPLIRAGFFDSSRARFEDVSSRYRQELLGKLGWH